MTRRQAKKKIKNRWRLKSWPGNVSPREMDQICSYITNELAAAIGKAFEKAILYGSFDGGLHAVPEGITGRSL